MIVCVLERPELDRLGAGHGDLEGIIDQLRLTRDIEVALLASASDTEANTYKFSMRSNHFVDVAAVAGKFWRRRPCARSGIFSSGRYQ